MGAILIILGVLALPVLLLLLLMHLRSKRRKREAERLGIKIIRLPVWVTVKASYALAWYNRKQYFEICWCWLLISAPIVFMASYICWPELSKFYCLPLRRLQRNDMGQLGIMEATALGVLRLLLGVSIAVAWHRLILRSEKPLNKLYLRFDKVVWGYLALGLFLLMLELLPTLIRHGIESVFESSDNSDLLLFSSSLLSLVIILIILPYIVRLQVMLPARALAISDITKKETMLRTRGNSLRLFLGQLLCSLPFIPLFYLLRPGCNSAPYGAMLYMVESLAAMVVVVPIYLSFLSLSYQYFFENGETTLAA